MNVLVQSFWQWFYHLLWKKILLGKYHNFLIKIFGIINLELFNGKNLITTLRRHGFRRCCVNTSSSVRAWVCVCVCFLFFSFLKHAHKRVGANSLRSLFPTFKYYFQWHRNVENNLHGNENPHWFYVVASYRWWIVFVDPCVKLRFCFFNSYLGPVGHFSVNSSANCHFNETIIKFVWCFLIEFWTGLSAYSTRKRSTGYHSKWKRRSKSL